MQQIYSIFPVTLVTSLQRKFHLRVAEWVISAMLISAGAEFAAAPNMFANNPFLQNLERFASQPVWAVTLLLIGFARGSALVINGAWRLSPHIRALLAFLSALVWLEIASGIAHLPRLTLGLVIYPWLAAMDLYAVWRAAGDARAADDHAKAIKTASA